MIQNTTPANQPAQVNPLLRRNQADDFIRLQDLFYLCLAKWRWFILSLAVTIGIATYYILTTPNVYQRTASLMIKDNSKSQGISSDVSSMFADMGLGNAKSNVNNELIAIQSPAVLLETGKRLKLDVDYAIDGAFHKEALYGGDLPVTVDFIGFTDDQSGSFQLQLKGDGSYVISRLKGITRDNLPVDDSDEISGRLGQIIHTPQGKIKVDKAPSYTQFVKNGDAPVLYVSRNIMLVAFVLGFLFPLVVIFVRENMNTTVRGRKDLKNMNVPFLGEIPYYVSRKNRPTLKQRIRFWKKPKEVCQIVVKAGKRNIVNEAFRVLRTNFEFTIGTHPEQNVIVFTSLNQGSGKSHLAANMAMSLAIKKKKVLLIDGDLRHGSASMLIGSPGEGLSDYLNGRIADIHDILHKGEESGLVKYFDVIPIGTIPPNPTELLFTPLLEQMIRQMRQEYDYVFIDCPPIEVVADTPIYEQFADRTIFVVRAGLMERSMLPEIDALYKEKKFKNMTLILNATKARGGRYGSHYSYGYGYGYGYNYNKEKNGGAKS